MKKSAYTTVPERFQKPYQISQEKLDKAIKEAIEKLEKNLSRWELGFVSRGEDVNSYQEVENTKWTHGLCTGLYWLAYELSGNSRFKEAAEKMLPTYQKRWENKTGFQNHDVGFVYSPSCVAAYRSFQHTEWRKVLLEAADYYYTLIDHCAGDQGFAYDGLICHVTGALPQGSGSDGIALYGDYFYLEALLRFAHPD